jgi:hypothetical protein
MVTPSVRTPPTGLSPLLHEPGQAEDAGEGEEPCHGEDDKEEKSEKGCALAVESIPALGNRVRISSRLINFIYILSKLRD